MPTPRRGPSTPAPGADRGCGRPGHETDLRAAERARAAYGAPYLLARTRLELGRWLAGQGRWEEAVPLLAPAVVTV